MLQLLYKSLRKIYFILIFKETSGIEYFFIYSFIKKILKLLLTKSVKKIVF